MIFKRTPTFRDWSITWLETYKKGNVVEKVYEDYSSIIKVRMLPFVGDMRLHKIKQVDVVRILNDMTRLTYYHMKRTLSIIRQIMNAAKQNGYIKANPTRGVIVPDGRKTEPRRPLTAEERTEFLELAETHRFGLWIKVLLLCGLRPGESARMRKRHIDAENKLLYVDGTKSKSSKRYVPLTDQQFIDDLLKYTANLQDDDLLFTKAHGGQANQSRLQYMWRDFKAQLDSCDDALCPYCLRHTFCTDLQHAGITLTIAAKLMGHSNPRITARVYTHYTDESLNVAAELLKKYREPQV